MKLLLFTFAFLRVLSPTHAQQQEAHLLGIVTRVELAATAWFQEQYDDYTPHPEIMGSLKKQDLKKYIVQVFFGSWCGDSKREMPRFLKIMDQLNVPPENIQIIGVDKGENYKQSPGREERGKAIYRVPTFVMYKNGEEKGRIVEYAAFSMERDLMLILQQKAYAPNYYSYPLISQWYNDGILKDKNLMCGA